MKVRDAMTKDVECVNPFTSLAAVVEVLWRRDCGIVPVVGSGGRVVGVLTDRDVAIALGTRQELAANVRTSAVMSEDVATCSEDQDLRDAVAIMKGRRVRRLPVVGATGRLVGLLSLHDLARVAGPDAKDLSYAEVASILRAIGQREPTETGSLAA